VDEAIYDYRIPKISIQPIVENALYHGIKNRRGGGTIRITGTEEKDSILITVLDDGAGMTPERLKEVRIGLVYGSSDTNVIYGLYNVNQRIMLNFGEEYGVGIDSAPEAGTAVTIRLPKILTEIVKN
jgi:two-component system sensor histidine kinase YesM